MKFAVPIRQLARIFVDAQSVGVTPADAMSFGVSAGLPQQFSSPFLLPLPMPDPAGGGPRLAIASQQLDWQLALLSQSFDLTRLSTDLAGSNMSDLADFARRAGDVLAAAAKHFGRNPHRLVLVETGLLEEMPLPKMAGIGRRLLRLPEPFNADPFEWDWRCGRHGAMRLDGVDEQTNIFASIKRVVGVMQVAGSSERVPIDRIQVELDVNTTQADARGRFNDVQVKEFFSHAVREHELLAKTMTEFALAEPS